MISRDTHILNVLAQGGLRNGSDALWASRITGLSLSYGAALLQNESWGENIFGCDPWNSSAFPAGPALEPETYEHPVTKTLYATYRARVRNGLQPNGVGPCQLTSPSLQAGADKRGGCWIPIHNMTEGFTLLRQLITEHGPQDGYAAYNGSGPAADAYGARAIAHANNWHTLLQAAGVT